MNSLFSKLKFLIHFLLLKVLYFASIGKRIADRRKWAVIVRTDHLGDLLCSVSFIEQLTGYYHEQGLSVAILVEPAYIELAMRICPCDRVIGIDPEKTVNIRYRTRIMRKLYAMNIRVLLGMVVPNQAYFIELFSFAREKHLFFQPVLFRQKNLLWLTRHYEYRHDILPGICMQDQYVRIFHEITGRTVSHRPLDLRRLLPEVRAKQMFRKNIIFCFPVLPDRKNAGLLTVLRNWSTGFGKIFPNTMR